MKKSNLLLLSLLSTFSVMSLTACNSGANNSNPSVQSNSLKNIDTSSLVEKLTNVQNLSDEEKITLIHEISATREYPSNPELQKLYSSYKNAIENKGFGTNHSILKEIALNIDILRLCNDLIAQDIITSNNLQETDIYSTFILRTIQLEWLSNNPEIQQILVTQLNNSNMDNSSISYSFISSIAAGRFESKNLELQNVILKCLNHIGNKNHFGSQRAIMVAINKQRFGSNQLILDQLINYVNTLEIIDKSIIDMLNSLINEGKFGNNDNIYTVYKNKLIQYNQHVKIKELINLTDKKLSVEDSKKILTAENSIKTAKYIFSKYYFDDKLKIKLSESGYIFDKYQFGNLSEFKTDTEEFTDNNATIKISGTSKTFDIKIQDYLDQAKDMDPQINTGYGSYGVVYDKDGNPDLLIVFAKGVRSTTINQVKEQMQGFLTINKMTQPIYGNVVELVKVYDFNKSVKYDGADMPELINEIMSSNAPDFVRFPTWLQTSIKLQEFDTNNFRSANLIKFVIDFVNQLPENTPENKELKNITLNTIQRVINNQGQKVELDINIKNEINSYMGKPMPIGNINVDTPLNLLWPTLTFNDKLKLFFLCAQLAKDGALGYHHGINNQANEFYYALAAKILTKMNSEHIEDINTKTQLINMSLELDNGSCIEQVSNKLLFSNIGQNIFSIWEKINQ